MNICSVRWNTPTSILLAGPSGSGKTRFLRNLLKVKNEIFYPSPESVIYFYKIYQPEYDLMKKEDSRVLFIDNFPSSVNSFKSLIELHKGRGCLVIFDDFEQ